MLRRPRLLSLAAGLLSATGFAPLELWPVTLACFALLLILVERAPDRRRAFALGWLFGLGHFTVGLNWIAHAFTFQDAMPHWFGYGAVVLLSLYLAVYPGFAALVAWWGQSRFDRRWPGARLFPGGPFALLFAAAWIVTEWLRATMFTGFAWNPLGVIWVPTHVSALAELVGTYGLSGLTILTVGFVIVALRTRSRFAFAVLAGKLAILLLGALLLHDAPAVPSPDAPLIHIVQPNIGQQDKYSPELEEANFRKLTTLSGKPGTQPRLLFWPEAAIPAYLDLEPIWRARLATLLGPDDLLLTGGTKIYFKKDGEGLFTNHLAGANNSLWIVTPQGQLIGRYDKAHLVPYGEYLPMRSILQPLGLSRLVPGDADFWPGPGPQSLTLPAVPGRPALKMGVQICYEIIFSGQVVDEAHRPAFLFNPSNDAWFGSWGPPQHLAQARLRAIEEGVPILRSTPTGISAVIDAQGRLLERIPHHRAGFIETRLPKTAAAPLFARFGNWLPLFLALALAALAIATARVRR